MKLCRLDNDNVRILLEKEDLLKYNLSAASLSDKSEETKAVFRSIVNAAKSKTDFDTGDDRILIEAFPKSNGEVLLYVTRLSLECERGREYLFSFDCADGLIEAYGALKKSRLEIIKKSYYKNAGRHYLCFTPVAISRADERTLDVLTMTLREYGEQIDGFGRVSYLEEHAEIKKAI